MTAEPGVPAQRSVLANIKSSFFLWFRLSNKPAVRLYNGFGNKTHCFLYGHAFSLSPLPRKRYRKNVLVNALALLRLFMVRTKKGALLRFTWDNQTYRTTSESDGFFKFEWQPATAIAPGPHEVSVDLVNENDVVLSGSKALLFIPPPNEFACISDIDDTFLISHSSNLRKRLFVLLTENAHSRNPFEGVVNHYQQLSQVEEGSEVTHPFFYVSSSEWNLYYYIRDFSAKNKLPEGVYLLNQIKRFSQVFKTGQNNHATKFMRITRILEAYPEQRFVLFGDDSQEDPNIYAAVVQHFPRQIIAVYIRQVGRAKKDPVIGKLEGIAGAGVHQCYFAHSSEAVIHSRQIGLIG